MSADAHEQLTQATAAGSRGPRADAPPVPAAASGDHIGPYKLLHPLGEGGFGEVWLAERREPFVQRVALKLIKPGMDSRAVLARFEQERQALAVMDHPNVARVLDGGATPAGRPYFVMEYVQGEAITDYCDRHRLTTRQRLELMLPVCEAVQHAHTKGVIHRDLKPANILVAAPGGAPAAGPVPKVIDFGVAKAISPGLTARTVFTQTGHLVGTPEYMSPEQADAGSMDVDTRADVYSLGVVLYELITGVLPFDSRDLRSRGFAEIARIIREVEPPKPSTRLTSLGEEQTAAVAERRRAARGSLLAELRRELDWIPLKAMRKDRAERYGSPADLARDIRNYLEGRPLTAGPESAAYRVRKFVRRNRAGVAVGAVLVLSLVAGVAGTSVGLVRANRAAVLEREARERESRQRAAAEATSGFLRGMFSSIDPEKARGREITVREVLDDAAARVGAAFAELPEAESELREVLGETYHQLGRFPQALEHLQRTRELRERTLGKDHADTLTTRHNIGAALLSLDRVEEAVHELTQAAAGRERTLGAGAPDTLATRSLLGYAMQVSGDDEGALAVYREVRDAQEKALGAGDKATLETMSSIADVLQDLGRFDEAERVSEELVRLARVTLGADAPVTLQARSIRASILDSLGRYAEGEALTRGVLADKERVLGTDHPDTLTTLNVLALNLEQQKKYDEQHAVLTRAIAAAEASLGSEHQKTLTYLSNLGRCEQLRGNLDAAEALMRRVLDVRHRTVGPDSVPTLATRNNLGLLLLDLKKPVEAEEVLRAMVDGLDRALDESHWMRWQGRMNLAQALVDQERFAEAEPLMVAGYEGLAKALPAGHSRLVGAAKELAGLYGKIGRAEDEVRWRKLAEPAP